MAGRKHAHSDNEMESSTEPSPFLPIFEAFRNELDEHQDRRERIIKISRDITALSKKIIFSLQRVPHLSAPLPPAIAQEIHPRRLHLSTLFATLSPDLHALNTHRYHPQLSPGIQEYIEATALQHYLQTQRLLTWAEAQAQLPSGVALMHDDYILGVFDLVGEMMRFAITGMATSGALPRGGGDDDGGGGRRDILGDLRGLRACLEGLDMAGWEGRGRDVQKKMEVMRACVEKVEGAVYGMIVRGRERPRGWVPPELGEGERGGVAVEGY